MNLEKKEREREDEYLFSSEQIHYFKVRLECISEALIATRAHLNHLDHLIEGFWDEI